MKFNLTIQQLKAAEKSVYSQAGQDGVLEAIFEQVSPTYIEAPSFRTCIEFGAGDGFHISNTLFLHETKSFARLLLDINPKSQLVLKESINAENINIIFEKYSVEKYGDIDLLCIDIDGNDWYVWKSLKINPKVVLIEYNSKFRNDESYAIEYNPDHKWEGDDYYSASLLAFKKLGEQKGYTLVYKVDQLDAVFVRNDLISPDYIPPTMEELLPEPIIAHEVVSNKKWIKV